LFSNPVSARIRMIPVAPARRTRAKSSSTKRGLPRWVFADPFRLRMCKTSLVPARVASSGW
jgi:hypothetical protein